MKSDDGVLNDIESAISGDWEVIQKEVRDKEEDKQWERRMNGHAVVPTYKIFVNLMRTMFSKLYKGEDLRSEPYELYELLKRMFYDSRDPMPKGFSKIWDIFCNNRTYRFFAFKCRNCDEVYDIVTKRRDVYGYRNYFTQQGTELRQYYCARCGTIIMLTEELVSMTRQEER